MIDVDPWDWYAGVAEDRAGLTSTERGLAAILDLRQEVSSGGFESYFRFWGGDSAPEALEALPGTLGEGWADLLRRAMVTLGAEYPLDADERADRIDDLACEDVLGALDEEFYALAGIADADALIADRLAR